MSSLTENPKPKEKIVFFKSKLADFLNP